MTLITFDLNNNVGDKYNTEGGEISLFSIDNNSFMNYKFFWHIVSGESLHYSNLFNLKYRYDTYNYDVIVTVELNGLFSGSYFLSGIEAYFRKDDYRVGPIVIGIIVDKQDEGSRSSEQVKVYYKFREIIVNGNGSIVKLKDLTGIEGNHLDKRTFDQEYKSLSGTLKINVHHHYGRYNGRSGNKIDPLNILHYVRVSSNAPYEFTYPQSDSSDIEYVKFTHTPDTELFNRVEVVCEDHCNLIDFNPSDYNDLNLEYVVIYFHKSDTNNMFPLLIEFKTKIEYKLAQLRNVYFNTSTSTYYKLSSIEKIIESNKLREGEISSNEKSDTYRKTYTKTELHGVSTLTDVLRSIYENHKIKDKIKMRILKENMEEESNIGIVIGILGCVGIPAVMLLYTQFNKLYKCLEKLCKKTS